MKTSGDGSRSALRVAEIRHHADHLQWHPPILPVPFDEASDLAARAEDPGGAAADHDPRHRSPVARVEVRAFHHASPDRREVAAADRAQRRHPPCAHLVEGPALRHEGADRDLFADQDAVPREAGGERVRRGAQPRQDPLNRLHLARDRVSGWEHQLKRQGLPGFVPAIHGQHSGEAVDQQAGADQQHGRHHELPDGQSGTQPRRLAARSASARAERPQRARSGEVERRQQAERDGGQRGDPQGDREHSRIDGQLLRARQDRAAERESKDAGRVDPGHLLDEGDPRRPERDAQQAAGRGQHGALGENLAHDSSPAGSQREPHRDLPAAVAAPRQEQVRDVRADDHQDDRHGGKKHPQRRPELLDRGVFQIPELESRHASVEERSRAAPA